MTPELVAMIKTYPWQCMECKTCIICGQPHHEEEMMFCDVCDRGYHTFCVGLDAIPSGNKELIVPFPPPPSHGVSLSKYTRCIWKKSLKTVWRVKISNSVGKHPHTRDWEFFLISFISVYLVLHSLTWHFLYRKYNWLLQQNPNRLPQSNFF